MADFEKKIVERVIDADTDRLFGEIKGAIKYLQEIAAAHPNRKVVLDEHWTGYEDNEFRFLYDEPETDEEHQDRVARELAKEEYDERQKSEAKERKRAKLLEQRRALDRELGELK